MNFLLRLLLQYHYFFWSLCRSVFVLLRSLMFDLDCILCSMSRGSMVLYHWTHFCLVATLVHSSRRIGSHHVTLIHPWKMGCALLSPKILEPW